MKINLADKSLQASRRSTFLLGFLLAVAMCALTARGAFSASFQTPDDATKAISDVMEAGQEEFLDSNDEEFETEEERLRAIRKKAQDYKELADANIPAGLTAYGECLEYGEGVEKNLPLAVEYYKRAAELGSEMGCLSYGRCKLHGIGCARDGGEAAKYLLRIAGADDDYSDDELVEFDANPTVRLRSLISSLFNEYGQDFEEASFFEKSFVNGQLVDVVCAYAPCCVLVQTAAYEMSDSGDSSARMLAKSDDNPHNPRAQLLLAEYFANCAQTEESLRKLKSAARGGDDRAMNDLADYYRDLGKTALEEYWRTERIKTACSFNSALALGEFYWRQSNNNGLAQKEKDLYKKGAETFLALAATIGDKNESKEAVGKYQQISGVPFQRDESLEIRNVKKVYYKERYDYDNGNMKGFIEWTFYNSVKEVLLKLRTQEFVEISEEEEKKWEKAYKESKTPFPKLNPEVPTQQCDGDWGFVPGKVLETTLKGGTILQRYGTTKDKEDSGLYLAPFGTNFGDSSLPRDQKNKRFTVYEVVKPFTVLSGPSAPWKDQPGGGTQIVPLSRAEMDEINAETNKEKQDKMINELRNKRGIAALLKEGYIRKVVCWKGHHKLADDDGD